ETRVYLMETTGTPPATAARASSRSKAAEGTNGAAAKPAPKPQAKSPDWQVAELYFERRGNRSIVGNIYKGRVDNVLPGLEAAFVDIGLDKNGFLHVDEIVMPGVEVARRGRKGGKGKTIGELLKPGQE